MIHMLCGKCGQALEVIGGPQTRFLVCHRCGSKAVLTTRLSGEMPAAQPPGPAPAPPANARRLPPEQAEWKYERGMARPNRRRRPRAGSEIPDDSHLRRQRLNTALIALGAVGTMVCLIVLLIAVASRTGEPAKPVAQGKVERQTRTPEVRPNRVRFPGPDEAEDAKPPPPQPALPPEPKPPPAFPRPAGPVFTRPQPPAELPPPPEPSTPLRRPVEEGATPLTVQPLDPPDPPPRSTSGSARETREEDPAPSRRARDPENEAMVERLAKTIANRKAKKADRILAMNELAQLGADGAGGSRALCETMMGPAEMAKFASLTLMKVNPDLHAPVTSLLFDRSYNKRLEALRRVKGMRLEAAGAVPILLYFKDTVLRGLQPGYNQVSPYESNPDVLLTVDTIAAVSPKDEDWTRLLSVWVVADPNPVVREKAAFWLGGVSYGKAAADALVEGLRRERLDKVRMAMIKSLGELGPDAKAAERPLAEIASTHASGEVREAANKALKRIQAEK